MRIWEDDPARALSFSAAEAAAPALGFIVEHDLLRSALWGALADVTLHAGADVVDCELDGERPLLTLADGRRLAATLVVAAEGADSALRERAGVPATALDYPQRALVCHVATQRPHGATAYQRFLDSGPLAFLPLADGRSSIVWSAEAKLAAELLALDEAAFCARLATAAQGVLGAIQAATPRQAFPLRLLHAARYAVPGLALVGDSAHVVHPLAGQGVNLGLADAQALATVLGDARAAGRRLGALRTLQRYERARRAANLEMLALTDALYRTFAFSAPAWMRLRRWGLATVDRLGPLKQFLMQQAMGL
jgi:2-polyprenylphenol 6-hydroxylase